MTLHGLSLRCFSGLEFPKRQNFPFNLFLDGNGALKKKKSLVLSRIFFFFFFFAAPQSMQDLSSLTRDEPVSPNSESAES